MSKKEGLMWLIVALLANGSALLDSLAQHKPWFALLNWVGLVVVAIRMGILIQDKQS